MFGQRKTGRVLRRYVVRVGLLLLALYCVHKGSVWDDLRASVRGLVPLGPVGGSVVTGSSGEAIAQIESLTRQVQARDEEIVRLYRRLATLSHFREHFAQSYPRALPARVVFRRDSTSLRRMISIDRGSEDGVQVGAPVIWGEGLVGLVKVVAPAISEVVLVTDPACRIEAYVRGRSGKGLPGERVVGILVGHPPDGCRLEFVPRTSRGLRVGLAVLTTGWRGRVPGDLVVGTLRSVEPGDNSSLLEVQVDPAVDVDRLSEVIILLRSEILREKTEGMANR